MNASMCAPTLCLRDTFGAHPGWRCNKNHDDDNWAPAEKKAKGGRCLGGLVRAVVPLCRPLHLVSSALH